MTRQQEQQQRQQQRQKQRQPGASWDRFVSPYLCCALSVSPYLSCCVQPLYCPDVAALKTPYHNSALPNSCTLLIGTRITCTTKAHFHKCLDTDVRGCLLLLYRPQAPASNTPSLG
jgi:hypothetical protein